MVDDRNLPPERPRVEPEIIPPDRSGRRSSWDRTPWRAGGFYETGGRQRIFVSRLGPFGIALLILAIAAVAAITVIAILGAVLIWIPVVAVLVVVAALFRRFGR